MPKSPATLPFLALGRSIEFPHWLTAHDFTFSEVTRLLLRIGAACRIKTTSKENVTMQHLSKKHLTTILSALIIHICSLQSSYAVDQKTYIGSKNCAPCHEEQYNSFIKHSKKAKSWDSVAIMKPKLKEQELQKCYECHTTGHNKGGFKSIESTPELADVGCETCHGPGSEHAENQDPQSIVGKPSIETCTSCHNSERIQDFKFKPLMFSGAH